MSVAGLPAGAALAQVTAWLCEVEGAVWEGMLSKHLLPETFVLITSGSHSREVTLK